MTNLMAPEAYVLESAVNDWDDNRTPSEMAADAAVAYNKYQKCGMAGAKRLFCTKK